MPGRCPAGIHHRTSVVSTVETLVQGLPDKALERFDRFPHRQVRQNGRIVIDAHVHGVAAVVLQPPHEAGDLVSEPVHALDVVDEFAHAQIIERISNPRDVELGQLMMGRL
jgi:hypothetical protein